MRELPVHSPKGSKIHLPLLCAVFLEIILVHLSIYACDMFGLISTDNSSICSHLALYDTVMLKQGIYKDSTLTFHSAYDALVFLGKRSSPSANIDGYGLVFYDNRNTLDSSKLFHQFGFGTYFSVKTDTSKSSWEKPLLNAFEAIKKCDSGVSAIFGHARTATGGIGNHPFWFHLDTDSNGVPDETFVFEHNGDCSPLKPAMLQYLLSFDSLWFKKHPLNWVSKMPDNDTLNTTYIIDSELLFHYIMANIIEYKGNAQTGIANALQKLGAFNSGFYHVINFILSNGKNIYAFKSTDSGSGFNLEYKNIDGNTFLIKTGQDTSFIDIPHFNLLTISKSGPPVSLNVKSLVTIPDNSSIKKWSNVFPSDLKKDINYCVTLTGRKISSARLFGTDVINTIRPISSSRLASSLYILNTRNTMNIVE
jgi:hypothetical protein